ncbi:MAG: AgmX/PglI C-terminal domain-containing protein [Pseudobdellovibrionaceae bacterium]
MQNLLIEHRGPTGLVKTWKLRSEQGVLTFGNSKHADLRTTVDSIKGIQGVFEYKNDKWHYVNLDLQTKHSEMNDGKTEMCIEKDSEIRLGTTTLHIKVMEGRPALFSRLEGDVAHSGAGRHPFQLFTVYSGSTLLETVLIPVHKTFVSQYDPTRTKFTPEKATEWKKTPIAHLEVSQRTVYLTDVQALKHMNPKDLVDEDGRKSLAFTLACALVLALLFLFSPKQETLDDALTTALPPREIRLEQQPKPPKKQAQSAPKEVQPDQKPQQAAAPKNKGTGSSKAASMIKSLASGRISSLVGKISAVAARSANVVVTSGVAAGTAPTGRALAALGSINKSGKDWSAEGKGTGITISTNGKAGGQGTGGMGTMAAGKTGSGGVGLLEDEGDVVGGLDREVIAAYIRSKLGEILYCYERQLSANPDLYGKVGIKFTIAGSGSVETQRIGDSTLRNATVEGCILQRVAKWKFPAPEGGTKVLVTYPFLFKSTN